MKRFHYMDNLRAWAMILGVVFHAALAYSATVHHIWPTADTSTSRLIDALVWFSHTFRMPLFFLIAGFFANFLLVKRGVRGFIVHRARRLVLPFIIFWPLVSLAFLGLAWLSITQLNIRTSALTLLQAAVNNPEASGLQGLSTGHLWFLYYLIIFCGLGACIHYVWPWPRVFNWLTSPLMLMLGWPCLGVFSLLFQRALLPPPNHFQPALWALLFYGSFFFVGWHFYIRQNMLETLGKHLWLLILGCGIAYPIYFSYIPGNISISEARNYFGSTPLITFNHIISVACGALLAWYLSFICLILGKKYLDTQNSTMGFIAASSYWLYIVHLPVLFLVQALLHLVEWPIIFELSLSITITISAGLLTYRYWVANSRIGALLNGPVASQVAPRCH